MYSATLAGIGALLLIGSSAQAWAFKIGTAHHGCLTHLKDCRPKAPKIPRSMQIRTIHFPQDIFPICWGNAQCWSAPNTKAQPVKWVNPPTQFYVIGHYACANNTNGKDNGAECVVGTNADSCRAAFDQQSKYLSRTADACVSCNPNVRDNTQHWGGQVNWTQDGPCVNQTP
jgi:hypothetical protein